MRERARLATASGTPDRCDLEDADAAVTVWRLAARPWVSPTDADSGESDQLTVESGARLTGAARTGHTTPHRPGRNADSTRVGLDSSRPLDSRIPGYGCCRSGPGRK